MRVHLVAAALLTLAPGAIAQSPVPAAALGTWRGTSKCLVQPSACHDEVIVYRITQLKTPDSVSIDGRKIVGGEEQQMGDLACHFIAGSGQLTCVIPQGVWHFLVRKDSLNGELRHTDNTRFREVRTARAPER